MYTIHYASKQSMGIATLETILACYNPICNADSMHVVPNVNRVHPLFHHTWKQRKSIIRPEHWVKNLASLPHNPGKSIGSASSLPHNGNEPINKCSCMHHKSMQHHFTDHDINIIHIMPINNVSHSIIMNIKIQHCTH